MLIVVKNGDVHFFLKTLFDDKALGCLDILQIDPAKCRPHQFNRVDKCLGVFGVQFDIDRIHIGEPLEQNRLAFHYRL